MDIALDTSLLVGLLDPQDLWHEQAIALEAALQSSGFQAVYFDCVIAETVSISILTATLIKYPGCADWPSRMT